LFKGANCIAKAQLPTIPSVEFAAFIVPDVNIICGVAEPATTDPKFIVPSNVKTPPARKKFTLHPTLPVPDQVVVAPPITSVREDNDGVETMHPVVAFTFPLAVRLTLPTNETVLEKDKVPLTFNPALNVIAIDVALPNCKLPDHEAPELDIVQVEPIIKKPLPDIVGVVEERVSPLMPTVKLAVKVSAAVYAPLNVMP
jgi:hypothetical protein